MRWESKVSEAGIKKKKEKNMRGQTRPHTRRLKKFTWRVRVCTTAAREEGDEVGARLSERWIFCLAAR